MSKIFLRITDESGKNEIAFEGKDTTSQSFILSADVQFRTIDELAANKSPNNMQTKVVITGILHPDINEQLTQLKKWAFEFSGKSMYRKVNIRTVTQANDGTDVLEYTLDNMFVLSLEYFNSSDEGVNARNPQKNPQFVLTLVQQENSWKQILVNCTKQ